MRGRCCERRGLGVVVVVVGVGGVVGVVGGLEASASRRRPIAARTLKTTGLK